MAERRFDDTQVTEIFMRATEAQEPSGSPTTPSEDGLILAELQEIMGLGPFAYLAATLPGWARTRELQMEGLAERISLLRGEENPLLPDE